MTTFQKVIKYFAIVLALLLVAAIIGGILQAVGQFTGLQGSDTVMDTSKTYSFSPAVHTLHLQINAADITIRQAEEGSVVSNLKYLTVKEENGVLTVKEPMRSASLSVTNASLVLNLPAEISFDRIKIETGAGQLTVDTLSCQRLTLNLGAGNVQLDHLQVSQEAEIEGGAGKIVIANGSVNGLDLDMGVGTLEMTAALSGDCDLNLGVGKSVLTLLGTQDDYQIEIEKGVGSITVDGKSVSDYGSGGNSSNHIEIEGGVGAIELNFLQK